MESEPGYVPGLRRLLITNDLIEFKNEFFDFYGTEIRI